MNSKPLPLTPPSSPDPPQDLRVLLLPCWKHAAVVGSPDPTCAVREATVAVHATRGPSPSVRSVVMETAQRELLVRGSGVETAKHLMALHSRQVAAKQT